MLKYVLLSVIITANIIACLIFSGNANRELYKHLKTNYYISAAVTGLTALITFITAIFI